MAEFDVVVTDESQDIIVEVTEGPEARQYAIIAADKALEAATSETNAKQSEIVAEQAKTLAVDSAAAARESELNSAVSEGNAKTSETAAAQSAIQAAAERLIIEQKSGEAVAAAETSTEKAAIAQAQAELVIGRGLYLPEDNLSITYNADGTVNTVSNGTLTKRITYSNGVAVSVATI